MANQLTPASTQEASSFYTTASNSTPTSTSTATAGLQYQSANPDKLSGELKGLVDKTGVPEGHKASSSIFRTTAADAPATAHDLQAVVEASPFVQKRRTDQQMVELLLHSFRENSSSKEADAYTGAVAALHAATSLPKPEVATMLKNTLLAQLEKQLPAGQAAGFSSALAHIRNTCDPTVDYEGFRKQIATLLKSLRNTSPAAASSTALAANNPVAHQPPVQQLAAAHASEGAGGGAAAIAASAAAALTPVQARIAQSPLQNLPADQTARLLHYTFGGRFNVDAAKEYDALCKDLQNNLCLSASEASKAVKTALLEKLVSHPDTVDKLALTGQLKSLLQRFNPETQYPAYREGMKKMLHEQDAKQRLVRAVPSLLSADPQSKPVMLDAAELICALETGKSLDTARETIRGFLARRQEQVLQDFQETGGKETGPILARLAKERRLISEAVSQTLMLPADLFSQSPKP
ncbi:MAG: hypothetical protein EOO28_04880 [Comamonadaceae bacterium]|nr:MAG: hypothetical protein EOO28_04880 [Comamonadaceae bacterium]